MDILPTRHGLRLSQHGVVISELRTSPGPTHSVFDLLAALIAVLRPADRIGILGFAGGGMMAPLRCLGVESAIDTVDLDRESHQLFRRHCGAWAGRVNWQRADAAVWLRRQPSDFSLLMDDLSVPRDGDVFKPDLCWDVLPALIRGRLRPDGFGVFNLLPIAGDRWQREEERIGGLFAAAHVIHLDDFVNRILVAGDALPSARELGAKLRDVLRRLRSRQAGRIHLRSLKLGPRSTRISANKRECQGLTAAPRGDSER